MSLRKVALVAARAAKTTVGSEVQFCTTTLLVGVVPSNASVLLVPKSQLLIVSPAAPEIRSEFPVPSRRSLLMAMLVFCLPPLSLSVPPLPYDVKLLMVTPSEGAESQKPAVPLGWIPGWYV